MRQDRLNRLLKIREAKREEKEIQIRRIKDEIDKEMENLKRLRGDLEYVIEGFNRSVQHGEVNTAEIDLQYGMLFDITRRINKQVLLLEEMNREYEFHKERLRELHKEKRMVETLLQRARRLDLKRQRLSEQHLQDFNSITKSLRDI